MTNYFKIAHEGVFNLKIITRNTCSQKCCLDKLTPGTDKLTPGTDKLTPGTDKLTPGTDKLAPGTDTLAPGTD